MHTMHGGGFRGGHVAGKHFVHGGHVKGHLDRHVVHGGHFKVHVDKHVVHGRRFIGHNHFGHSHFKRSVFIAPVVLSPFVYYPARSYTVTAPVVYEEPQTFIYQDVPAVTDYKYYCKSSDLYYPDAKECPEGWL